MLTTPVNMYILAIQSQFERLDWFNENCDFIMSQRVKTQSKYNQKHKTKNESVISPTLNVG